MRPAGCCLCSDDETTLTEILNTRSLRTLGLVRLAPTVLVSAKPQADMGEVFPMPALGDPATMARKLLGHR